MQHRTQREGVCAGRKVGDRGATGKAGDKYKLVIARTACQRAAASAAEDDVVASAAHHGGAARRGGDGFVQVQAQHGRVVVAGAKRCAAVKRIGRTGRTGRLLELQVVVLRRRLIGIDMPVRSANHLG